MLKHEDNELICRVGNGTAMGDALRRYWWPVLLSEELQGQGRDCTPQPIRLLGERLVAYRDAAGTVHVLEEACPHRGASLALGIVEDCAIRCLYHGWKIAGDGRIIDAPNVSHGDRQGGPLLGFRAAAFPAREAGGIIWTYIGPADLEPPFMDYYWFSVPEDQRWISLQIIDANYVQVVEGSLDPSHFAILHHDSMVNFSRFAAEGNSTSSVLANLAPRIEVDRKDHGFVLNTRRAESETHDRIRPTVFVAPSTMIIPTGMGADTGGAIMVTPLDDYRSVQIFLRWDDKLPIGTEPYRSDMQEYLGVRPDILAAFGLDRANCDRPGKPAMANRFLQDRAAIAAGTDSTGLPDFIPEDVAMSVSQGRIADRSREHLVRADIGCVEYRRLLIKAASQVREGMAPIGIDQPVDTYALCSREYLAARDGSDGDVAPRNTPRPLAKA